MATKGRPINRPPRRQIAPEAIEAFRRMQAAYLMTCTCSSGGPICTACAEWWAAHAVLHHALRLEPWEWPAVEHPEAQCPYPAGTYAAALWRPDECAVALYRELEAAISSGSAGSLISEGKIKNAP